MANNEDEGRGRDPTDVSDFLEPAGIETHKNRPLDISDLIDQGEALARLDPPRTKKATTAKAAPTPKGKASSKVDDRRVELSHTTKPTKVVPLGGEVEITPRVTFDGSKVDLKDKRVNDIQTIVNAETQTTRDRRVVTASTLENGRSLTIQTRLRFDISPSVSVKKKFSTALEVYCPQTTADLAPAVRWLACAIHAEGGSRPGFSEEEKLAIGWCIRNRFEDVLRETKRWQDEVARGNAASAEARWLAGPRWWCSGPQASKSVRASILTAGTEDLKRAMALRGVLNQKNINGVPDGDPEQASFAIFGEFLKCWDPRRHADSDTDCLTLIPQSVQAARDVLGGAKPDPYLAECEQRGLRKPWGVFYYQTIKSFRAKRIQKAGESLRDLSGQVPSTSAAKLLHHVHFGIGPDYPPSP